MGYILKHRGGSNFGSGRLKSQEQEQFIVSLNTVMSLLRNEAGMEASLPTATSAAVTQQQRTTTTTTTLSKEDALAPTIACIEGALAMYKGASDDNKADVLHPLRSALMMAVQTLNQMIAEEEVRIATAAKSVPDTTPPPSPPLPPPVVVPAKEDVITTSLPPPPPPTLSDEEQLIKAYNSLKGVLGKGGLKNAAPQELDGVASLLSFTTETLGKEAPPVSSISSVEITKPPPVATTSVETTSSSLDDVYNEAKLLQTYSALKDAAGDGKYGLKPLQAQEADNLADLLSDMKGVLLDELNLGGSPGAIQPTAVL